MGFISLSKKLGATAVTAAALMMAREAMGDNGYSNGYWWIENNGVAMIYDYDGEGGAITIPSSIEGYPVGVIGREAFSGQSSITTLHIPDSVTYVDYGAFGGCQNLTEVRLPQAGAQIGQIAFAGCIGLTSIEIPSGLGIGQHAFSGCAGLTSVTLNEGVTYIGDGAFTSCSSLPDIKIPNSTTSLGAGLFQDCTSLKTATLPSTITYIPGGIFTRCSNLDTITIPDKVQSIGMQAFSGCTSLKSVTFPRSIKGIDTAAFIDCANLTKVCFLGNEPLSGESLFLRTPVSEIYYQTGTGWGTNFQGLPTVECNQCVGLVTPPAQTGNVLQTPTLPHSQATNLVVVIHGTTPDGGRELTDRDDMVKLKSGIESRLSRDGVNQQWDVVFYNWSTFPEGYNSSQRPQSAVRNAVNTGTLLGQAVANSQRYQKVLLLGHSAGAWLANMAASELNTAQIETSVTFLDAFVPSKVPWPFKRNPDDDHYYPDRLGAGLPKVEQYYETDWTEGQLGVGIKLNHVVDHDTTPVRYCPDNPRFVDTKPAQPHGWPIRWYTETVKDPTYGFGYQVAFNITGPDTVLSCDAVSAILPPAQSQTLAAGRRTLNVAYELPPMPPLPDLKALAEKRLLWLATRTNTVEASSTLSANRALTSEVSTVESVSTHAVKANNETWESELEALGTEATFADMTVVAQGGDGNASTTVDGVQLSTTNFIWRTFNINTTNRATVGTLDYALSAPCNSVVGMWMDGKPMTFIQSMPQNELSSLEIFTLPSALNAGDHLLTVSFESLDRTPVAATFKTTSFHYVVAPPVIASQSVGTNGDFAFMWEAGAGLKYQPQFNDSLTSTNWNNLGGLLTSPTNAIMSAFDAINTNSQRFYRIKMSAD